MLDDLVLFVSYDQRIVYLIKLITESGDYEEDFIKIRLEVIAAQREERKQQVEKKEG